MIGSRHQSSRASGRQTLVVSVLVLLALACFPVLAHADSSEVQYQDAPPTVTGTKVPKDHKPPTGKSHSGGGSTSAQASKANGSGASGKGSSAGGSSSGSGTGTGGVGTGQQGSPGKASGRGSGSSGQATGNNASPTSSQGDSGSSPLVPILIAILALAAISLGAVMIRQRRRRGTPGAQISPKAG
jgi:cobalamin biosynthesis Mg chelatase CobN